RASVRPRRSHGNPGYAGIPGEAPVSHDAADRRRHHARGSIARSGQLRCGLEIAGPAPPGGAGEARSRTALCLRKELSPRVRPPLFRRPGGRQQLLGMRQLPGNHRAPPAKGRSARAKPVSWPRARRPVPKPPRDRARQTPDAADDLPAPARALFDRLRALRREIAREEEVPAYIVFDDKTLRQIAVHHPRTLSAFGELRGIGPVKTERFGARFMAALADDQG